MKIDLALLTFHINFHYNGEMLPVRWEGKQIETNSFIRWPQLMSRYAKANKARKPHTGGKRGILIPLCGKIQYSTYIIMLRSEFNFVKYAIDYKQLIKFFLIAYKPLSRIYGLSQPHHSSNTLDE